MGAKVSGLKIQFGKRLRILRKQAGLTQDQLAESINVSVETVSNMERGIHGPKFDTLEKIANVMGLEVKTLFDFEALS